MSRLNVERTRSEPTLEWEGMTVIGGWATERRSRARARRWRLLGLALFWIGVGALLVRVFGP